MIKSFVVLLGIFALFGCSVALPASNFIVGGSSADITKIPFQAAILYNGRLWCGASILDNTTLLSAAHCFDLYFDEGRPISYWSATAGSGGWAVEPVGSSQQLVNFKSIYSHPFYDKNTLSHDVAIIKLDSTLVFSLSIQPVKLPYFETVQPGESYQVSGWGSMWEDGPTSTYLLKVVVPALSQSQCLYMFGNLLSHTMFCAGDLNGKYDSCQGDSGGPLVSLDNVQLGIVSWGLGCARKGLAGVYTEITKVVDWILPFIE